MECAVAHATFSISNESIARNSFVIISILVNVGTQFTGSMANSHCAFPPAPYTSSCSVSRVVLYYYYYKLLLLL